MVEDSILSYVEWTHEGSPKVLQVVADGNPNRYDGIICQYVKIAILGG